MLFTVLYPHQTLLVIQLSFLPKNSKKAREQKREGEKTPKQAEPQNKKQTHELSRYRCRHLNICGPKTHDALQCGGGLLAITTCWRS